MSLKNYEFSLPTSIFFGEGISKETGKKARELGATKVLLVADKGVIGAGLTAPVEESLKREGIPYTVYDQIVPNPRDYHCEEGYRLAKKEGVDCLVAVGGGSSMDTAKVIGTLLTHGKAVQDWCGFQLLEREVTPLIAIPTTAGTGSEVTPFAVVTDTKTHVKLNIFDPKAAAKTALVDPTVLLRLPSHIMAATGVDAMTHAVESYTCKLANPHTEAYSLYAIDLISKNLRKAVAHPDLESCTGMMLGSTIAGIAFGYSDVGAVHCIAEALGGRYDTPHGVACAVGLPAVTEFNIPADPEKHAELAKALGVNISGMSSEAAAMAGVEELRKLCKDVGIPKLRDIRGVNPKDFPSIAEAAEKNVSTPSNPREVSAKDFLFLINKIYNED
ncbi:iron-containing alcohol dehydrogenase [Caproicibacter sp. BJN0012]|uniref:iron-containing alcohol dehydrogenase n=1 Tax=Caproicibacter sp. BJN0012 TaxID=3110227 RepID=UPI002E11EC63